MMEINGKNAPKRRFSSFEGEWEQRKLANIASMHARIGWQNLRTSEFLDNGDYYLITGTDFLSGRINFEKCHYVNKERYQQDKKIQVGKGSILITKDGTLGKVALVTELNKPATLNAGVFNVVVKDPSINETYLYQYLAAPFLMDYVSKRATGGTIKHLNQGILVDFPIEIPSYKEQETIGQFLGCLDNAVTLHQHKLDKLKNLKKAYLTELFPSEGERVPKRRFPGFEGEWKEKKLGEVVEFKRGLTYTPSSISKAGIRVLRSSNIDEDQFVLKEDDVFVDESKISIPFVEKGDILITAANGSSRLVGKHAIIDSTEKMVHGGFMLLAKSNQYKFINALLSSNWYTHFIDRSVLGGNGAIGNLSKSDLENEVPLFPSDEEQKQIGEFFQKIDKSISLQQEKLDKLKDLKKAYLNELFV